MTTSGVSAVSSYAQSQQVQSLTQPHKKGRRPSISDVNMQGANGLRALGSSGPTGGSVHKVDIRV
jgi:hypothetical protein